MDERYYLSLGFFKKVDDYNAEWDFAPGTTKQWIHFSWNQRGKYLHLKGGRVSCFGYPSRWAINLHIDSLRKVNELDITFPEINVSRIRSLEKRRGIFFFSEKSKSILQKRKNESSKKSIRRHFDLDNDELVWREGYLRVRNKRTRKLRSIPESLSRYPDIQLIIEPDALQKLLKIIHSK